MSSGFDVAERARKEMQEIGGKCGNNNKYTHWYSDNVENIGTILVGTPHCLTT